MTLQVPGIIGWGGGMAALAWGPEEKNPARPGPEVASDFLPGPGPARNPVKTHQNKRCSHHLSEVQFGLTIAYIGIVEMALI